MADTQLDESPSPPPPDECIITSNASPLPINQIVVEPTVDTSGDASENDARTELTNAGQVNCSVSVSDGRAGRSDNVKTGQPALPGGSVL